MGQSPSHESTSEVINETRTRYDDASTRTLHSSSMNSHLMQQQQQQSDRPLSFFKRISNRISSNSTLIRRRKKKRMRNHATSITSSVRRATQEATMEAAAVTGPPLSPSPPIATTIQTSSNQSTRSGHSNTTHILNNDYYWNDLLSLQLENNISNNTLTRYLQIPLRRVQQEIETSSLNSNTSTSRRMHILVIEYRNTSSPPIYRFLGLRRPRSQLSTTSSTDTILSSTDNTTNAWILYLLNQLNNSEDENNNSYEELLRLGNLLGNVRQNTTTQQLVDETIPIIDYAADNLQKSCLVCLDDFKSKQKVRLLKCNHLFHPECIDRWLCEAHNSCPVCRRIPTENST